MTSERSEATTPANDPLADLKEFDAQRYADIDLDRLTALGVSILEERSLPATFENVVVTLHRLFPEKFALLGFPQYPDAARVNRALLHGQPKYRNYLTGGARSGYVLTHVGKAAAEETAILIEQPERVDDAKRRKPVPRGVADQFMREVSESEAYKTYSTGHTDEIEPYAVTRILHATPDTPTEVLRRNMRQLQQYAKDSGREDILRFLDWAQSRLNLGL